ncbi:hypothetical protein [Bifidobacterium sp. SO1]|uniref:hypothetical protein n=1 Tax=Bifidobacterium sp. SO1 TaxID=2809029 RepID=UPI001BDCB41C|nr:hypothetical protein [Bifidobacterium sp. SO1]MBT1162220.1 hypothetical protein [Bifidobacterium sp. SO1]
MNKPTTQLKARYEAVGAIFKDTTREHGWNVSTIRSSQYRPIFAHTNPNGGDPIHIGLKTLAHSDQPTLAVIDRAQNPLKQWQIDTDSITDMMQGVAYILNQLEEEGA